MVLEECIIFDKLIFNSGLLDKSVDATYVINLIGNGRLESCIDQLNEFKPTSIAYIVLNKGYKNCKKDSHVITPPIDIIDVNIKIFKHANENNFKNILILEDDFIFSEKIKKSKVLQSVNNFVSKKTDTSFIYSLGNIPSIIIPVTLNFEHYYGLFCGNHACIYSRKYRDNVLSRKDLTKLKDWDMEVNAFAYMYYEPLCYQIFPETENKQHWGKNIGRDISEFFIKSTGIDKKTEPGYSIMYALSKILIFIIIPLIFFAIIYIILKIINLFYTGNNPLL